MHHRALKKKIANLLSNERYLLRSECINKVTLITRKFLTPGIENETKDKLFMILT